MTPRPSRRDVLKAAGAAALCWGAAPRLAYASAPTKTLVVVFLRGGADGLNLVVPYGDGAYAGLRPTLAVPPPGQDDGALDLDGFFGLHPRMHALLPCFADGQAMALHAVGREGNTRSHFEEQDVWETGAETPTPRLQGWANRTLQGLPATGPLRAVSVGESLPRLLQGEASALALRDLADLELPGRGDTGALEGPYAALGGRGDARELLRRGARDAFLGLREVRNALDGTPEGDYPDTALGRRLSLVGRLIRADVGLQVAGVDMGGWDTHQNQPNGFDPRAEELAGALAALTRDLGPRLNDTLILTLTDFGRTAAENGTRGTDHGTATSLLALGGPVLARRAAGHAPVAGTWPGLGELYQHRDLAPTTDFRDVLAESLTVHLDAPHVLPDWSGAGLFA